MMSFLFARLSGWTLLETAVSTSRAFASLAFYQSENNWPEIEPFVVSRGLNADEGLYASGGADTQHHSEC